MAGLLNIGLTGLSAAQAQLSTVSHNITNADRQGYHRQTVGQTYQNPMFVGAGFFGQGTRITEVSRSYNQFLETQVLQADTRRAEYATYNEHISQINGLLADRDAGLAPRFENFFQSVQEVATNPTSVASRQSMISNAQSLVSGFQSIDQRLGEVRQGVEGEIALTVEKVNSYATQIADINKHIVLAQSGSTAVPNDLLDQRNLLVGELNTLVKTSVVSESDGSLTVFVGSGQSLVQGATAAQFAAVPSAVDPQRNTLALVGLDGSSLPLPEHLITGGKLGGLLGFRSATLDPTQARLNELAGTLANDFNAVHRAGFDLDGVAGSDFFGLPPAGALPREFIAGLSVGATDPRKIAAAAAASTAGSVSVADNRNALELAGLQTTKQMSGGNATYQSFYAQMVSEIGNKTREVRVNESAQTSLLNQAKDAREATSGVNLDEEAANLIRYQQAYQASARVMSIAQTLFDEVLSVAR